MLSILLPEARHLIGWDTNPADQLWEIPTQYPLDYLSLKFEEVISVLI